MSLRVEDAGDEAVMMWQHIVDFAKSPKWMPLGALLERGEPIEGHRRGFCMVISVEALVAQAETIDPMIPNRGILSLLILYEQLCGLGRLMQHSPKEFKQLSVGYRSHNWNLYRQLTSMCKDPNVDILTYMETMREYHGSCNWKSLRIRGSTYVSAVQIQRLFDVLLPEELTGRARSLALRNVIDDFDPTRL